MAPIKKETTKAVAADVKVLAGDVKAAAESTAASVKETAKETAAIVKETVTKKKAAAKKTIADKKPAGRKSAVKVEEKVFIQFNQKEATPARLVERAKDDYIAAGHAATEIKSVAVYLKPEEDMVYYVINESADMFAGSFPF